MIALLLLLLARPDPAVTPGVVRPLTTAQVCQTRWGHDRRHVTAAMKRHIAAAYGRRRAMIVGSRRGPCCEFDHLIPRSLGGADDVRNLWIQNWAEARRKDRVEVALHRAVCRGDLPLAEAQRQMRRWGRP